MIPYHDGLFDSSEPYEIPFENCYLPDQKENLRNTTVDKYPS